MGPWTQLAKYVCEFEDMIHVLRPADELRSIDALRTRTERLPSRALRALAEVRHESLRGRFADWASGTPIVDVCNTSLQSQGPLAAWCHHSWKDLSDGQRQDRRSEFARWRDQIIAGIDLAMTRALAQPRPLVVGVGGTCSFEEIDPLLDLAGSWLGIPDMRGRRRLVERVRRFPVRFDPGGKRFGKAGQEPLALLDRVDALATLWEHFPVPQASVLIQSAREALGFVLRDASVVRRLLAIVERSDGPTRRVLVVAAGLLGEDVPFDEAVADRADFSDVGAWVLATVLADWKGAVDRIREADRVVEGAARKVTDLAVMRLDAGAVFSIVS